MTADRPACSCGQTADEHVEVRYRRTFPGRNWVVETYRHWWAPRMKGGGGWLGVRERQRYIPGGWSERRVAEVADKWRLDA